METEADDVNRAMMLDGNAVAGRFAALFGAEMTTSLTECASCGQDHMMGALLAFTHAPGVVLRCPSCEAVMIKLVETPRGVYLDARGAAFVRIAR
ncbi:hypothetical protein VW23_018340 [Devosia insulae DS-56]|uniref:Uncharacterized protein n=1 Tax=Devosia insulae DS-56 TaxID=1116389 RepID=A0A1E5XR22_9HYPH|nr:DUF6510 family protein [Devosia insulae]OEO31048.1 hypothetical protein VW23_018340 [Devosia insulae DS-56]